MSGIGNSEWRNWNGKVYCKVIQLSQHSIISRYRRWLPALALVVLLPLTHCSSKKVTYYKPGGDQYKFDNDSERCLGQAELMARTKLVNPDRKPYPDVVQKYYEGCLYGRGWSRIPMDQRDRSLWNWKGRQLYVGKYTLELPPGFSLLTEARFVIGSTWSHQLQAVGEDKGTFLFLVAQEDISNPFDIISYPPPNGYGLYTGGRLDKLDIHWSVFTGKHDQIPVAVLGAYIYLEKTQRVSVVFSRTLTASGKPLKGYSLSLTQKKELEQIYPAWLSWIKAQTDSKELVVKPGFRRFFRFFW